MTPLRPQEPLSLVVAGFTYGDATNLATLGGSGTGAVTYTVTNGPCVVDGTSLTATGVGSCTVSAAKAGDGFYDSATAASATITVSPRVLNVVGAKVLPKVADGTATAKIEGATLVGVVDGDDVELAGSTSGLFAETEPGTGIPVLTGMTLSGADAANYILVTPTLSGTIKPAPYIEPEPTDGDDGDETTPPADQPGDVVTTTVCELEPGSEVTVTLVGDDTVIGSATVGADGCAEVEATLPSNVVLGDATLRFAGTNTLGEQVALVKDVTVYAPVPNRAPSSRRPCRPDLRPPASRTVNLPCSP